MNRLQLTCRTYVPLVLLGLLFASSLKARSVEPLKVSAEEALEGIQLLDYIEKFYDQDKQLELSDILASETIEFEDLTGYGTTIYGDGRFWYKVYINYQGETPREAL